MPRGAPKCRTCGLHPRSKEHRDNCAASKAVLKKTRVVSTRRSPALETVSAKELPEDWVVGKTCVNCRTTYTQTPMPEFQDADAKHGQYNMSRQLPDTSPDYPNCATCLEYAWRAEGRRFGMEVA